MVGALRAAKSQALDSAGLTLPTATDEAGLRTLEENLSTLEGSASDEAKVELARVLWLLGEPVRARALLEDVTLLDSTNLPAQSLLGWLVLAEMEDKQEEDRLDDEDPSAVAMRALETALRLSGQDLDTEAGLGMARLLRHLGRAQDALDLIAQLVETHPWLVPCEIERAKTLLTEGSWDEAAEAARRALVVDAHNAEACLVLALHAAAKLGQTHAAAAHLRDLDASLAVAEPCHWRLMARAAVAFSGMASHDGDLLAAATSLAQRAHGVAPKKAEVCAALGICLARAGQVQRAQTLLNQASELDGAQPRPALWSIWCLVLDGRIEEAGLKVDALVEGYQSFADDDADLMAVAGTADEVRIPRFEGLSHGDQALLLYLKAVVLWMTPTTAMDGPSDARVLPWLDRAVEAVGLACRDGAVSLELLGSIDVSLGLDIALLTLQHVGGEPRRKTEAPPPVVSAIVQHLHRLQRVFPGHPGLAAASGVCMLLVGNIEGALRREMQVLQDFPGLAEAYLVVARAHVELDNPSAAMRALETGVTHCHKIQSAARYHVIMARIALAQAEPAQAIKHLQQADRASGARGRTVPRVLFSKDALSVTVNDRASIMLLEADAWTALGRQGDAHKSMQRAMRELAGTPEEARIALAATELRMQQGDVSGAIKEMEEIKPGSPLYVQARTTLARIYLERRRDRAAYIQCFQDIVDQTRDKASYVAMGEALMAIQEPLLAVPAFKEALSRDPRDAALAMRTGSALISTHDFHSAVDYFEKAINANPENVELKLELGDLLTRIGSTKRAGEILGEVRDRAPITVEGLQARVRAERLLADVEKAAGRQGAFIIGLAQALSSEEAVLDALRGEHPELIAAESERAADLGFALAEAHLEAGNRSEAKDVLVRAVRRQPGHAPAGLALARMHLAAGDVTACQSICDGMLRVNADNDGASILLAEVATMQGDVEPAVGRLEVILGSKPNKFEALVKLVRVLQRTGRLDRCKTVLADARRSCLRHTQLAGFHVAEGLFYKVSGRADLALRSLNLARGDAVWGTEAACLMAEVYLDPNAEALWAAAGDDEDGFPDAFGAAVTAPENLEAAASVLATSPCISAAPPLRQRVLEIYVKMASGRHEDAEAALAILLDIAGRDREHVPTLMAMATAFLFLRQKAKARNQLKRISKLPYTPEYGDEFERAWLSLASMYVKGGKFDLAQDLCRKCLKYNQSCGPAWEIMGQMLEREGAYKDAAEHYSKTWELMHQTAPAGFRLAFNHLKAEQYVEAMQVAYQVLDLFPDYDAIRTDVLEEAWARVRP